MLNEGEFAKKPNKTISGILAASFTRLIAGSNCYSRRQKLLESFASGRNMGLGSLEGPWGQ